MLLRSGKIINSVVMSPLVAVVTVSCPRSSLVFTERAKLHKHTGESRPTCRQCKKEFKTLDSLQNHQHRSEHCYCGKCDAYFKTIQQHLTHLRATTHESLHHCCDCDRDYPNRTILSNHCCDCDEVFRHKKGLKKHFRGGQHANTVEPSKLKIQKTLSLPHECKICDESFQTKEELKKHKKLRHRHIGCPTGAKCKKKFATPAGLLSHLESGRCASGMTRARLHQLVFAHDTNRYITSTEAVEMVCSPEYTSASSHVLDMIASLSGNQTSGVIPALPLVDDDDDDEEDNLSEWSVLGGGQLTPALSDDSWSTTGGGVALTPTSSENGSEWSLIGENQFHTPSNTSLSTRSLNLPDTEEITQIWRCRLCRPDRKPFRTVTAFQAHLMSAAHAPKIFHCPLSFMPKMTTTTTTTTTRAKAKALPKSRSFSTLAGLTQHLESGRCVGGGLDLYSRAIAFVEEQLERLGLGASILMSA